MDITKNLKDAAYIAVGLGVIGFQRAQVRRVELRKQLQEQRQLLETQAAEARQQVGKLVKTLEARFEPVVDQVEENLDRVEERLPEQAKTVFKQARQAAREVQDQFRARLTTTATSTNGTKNATATAAA